MLIEIAVVSTQKYQEVQTVYISLKDHNINSYVGPSLFAFFLSFLNLLQMHIVNVLMLILVVLLFIQLCYCCLIYFFCTAGAFAMPNLLVKLQSLVQILINSVEVSASELCAKSAIDAQSSEALLSALHCLDIICRIFLHEVKKPQLKFSVSKTQFGPDWLRSSLLVHLKNLWGVKRLFHEKVKKIYSLDIATMLLVSLNNFPIKQKWIMLVLFFSRKYKEICQVLICYTLAEWLLWLEHITYWWKSGTAIYGLMHARGS